MNAKPFRQGGPLLALFSAGVAVRFWNLGGESLWMDEIFSMRITGGSLADVSPRAAAENAPPLYFWLLYAWRQTFGDSEAAVRALSALIGSATLVAIYDLARRLAGPLAAAIAATLAVFSCQQLYHAQEVRPYGLLMLLAILSTSAWLRWRQQPNDRKAAIGYIVLAAAGVYTHFFGVFVIAVHVLTDLVIWRERTMSGKFWFATNAVLAILLAPAAQLIIGRGQQVAGGFWTTTPDIEQLLRLYSQFFSLHLPPAGNDPKWLRLAWAAPVGIGLGLLVAWFEHRRRPAASQQLASGTYTLLLVWLLLPPLATWLISQSALKVFVFRYLAISAPAALLLAAVLASRWRPLWRWPTLGLLLAIAAVNSHLYLNSVTRQQWRELAVYLQPRLQSDDGVLFDDPISKPLFDYYAPQAAYRHIALGEREDLPPRIWAVLFSIKDEARLRQEFSRLAALGYDDVSRKSFFTIVLLELRQIAPTTGSAP